MMLNNCVGFSNYKLFVLLNLYGFIFCAFVAATLLQILIWQLVEGRLIGNSIQFLIICVYAFGVGLCCLTLFLLHCYLISINRTTIEHMEYKDLKKEGYLNDDWYGYNYDVGWKENWAQAFGDNPWLWMIPISSPSSKCDGVVFPKRQQASV